MLTRLTIRGMNAVHAVRAVYTSLTGVDGIVRAEVRLGWAEVEHDGRATEAALRDAVDAAGFEVLTCEEERRRLPLLSHEPRDGVE